MDDGDRVARTAGRARLGGKLRRHPPCAWQEGARREVRRADREPGGRQRDRAGEQVTEPGGVAQRGQRHDGALLVLAPPAQVGGHRAVHVPQRRRIVERGQGPQARPSGTAGQGDGGGLPLAETVDDQDRSLVPARRGERAQLVRAMMQHRHHACARKPAAQLPGPLPGPRSHPGKARRPRQRPAACRPRQRQPERRRDFRQVAARLEVIGDRPDIARCQAGLLQQPGHGAGRVLPGVLAPAEPLLLRQAHQCAVYQQGCCRVMGERANS